MQIAIWWDHTGIIGAAKNAVEAVDAGVGLVLDAIKQKGGIALVTADHGNADCMLAEDGTPFTAHTTNEVPFICVDYRNGADGKYALKQEVGALSNIAPTLLAMIGLNKPEEMTAASLLEIK